MAFSNERIVSSGLSKRGLVGLERSGSTSKSVNAACKGVIVQCLPMTLPLTSQCFWSRSEVSVDSSVTFRTLFTATSVKTRGSSATCGRDIVGELKVWRQR